MAVEILRELLGVDLPADAPARNESNSFDDRPSTDFHPDTVITIGPPQAPVHGVIVEIQQHRSESKRRQLPRYAAALWLMLDCPVTILVLCPNSKSAGWYTDPVDTNLPGYVFQAAVLGPDRIPVVTDPLYAAAHPEVAAMAVMVHGRRREVAQAFVSGMFEHFDRDHAARYYEHAYTMSALAIRRILEEIMKSSPWPVKSPFAREHFGRGEAQGRVAAAARAILLILDARGLAVSDEANSRITACTDLHQLETWTRRAATADTTDDLFHDPR